MTYSILALIIFSMSVWIVVIYWKLFRAKKWLRISQEANQEQKDTIYNLRSDIRVLVQVSPEQKKEVKQRWEIRFREEHLFSNLKR